jgi:hypothetical protein
MALCDLWSEDFSLWSEDFSLWSEDLHFGMHYNRLFRSVVLT